MKMKKLLSVLTAAVLGMAFALPLNAAPISVPKPEQAQTSAVEQVKHRKHWRHKHYRHWRGVVTGTGGTHGGTAATMADVTRAAIIAPTIAPTTATVITTRAITVAQESASTWTSSCGR
jgi:hypothetical protein